MSSLPEVSVILPTLALRERASLIRRACASVLEQEGVRSELILVVNGARRDTGLVAELAKDRRTRLASLEAADLPAALRRGRELVETPWFAELDDDDVMLPGALARRVRALQARPDCVAVVQNGIVRRPGGDRRVMEDVDAIRGDPLRALLRGNWLLPGSWLCRSRDVDATLFDGMPSSLECTYLAVRLALWGPIRFLDRPGVVWHERMWPSASSARRHLLGHQEALERILELDLPPDVRRAFRQRRGWALHAAADVHLEAGELAAAWRSHLRSLLAPGGWRRLPFTRRLLASPWSRRIAGGAR